MKRSEDFVEELTVEEYFSRYKSTLIFETFMGRIVFDIDCQSCSTWTDFLSFYLLSHVLS